MCPRPGCGKALAIGSLQSHLCTQHGMDASGSMTIESAALVPRLYKLSFICQPGHSRHRVPCPQQRPISGGISSIAIILTVYTWKKTVAHLLTVGYVVYRCHFIHCSGAILATSSALPTFDGTNDRSGMRLQQERRPEHSPLMELS